MMEKSAFVGMVLGAIIWLIRCQHKRRGEGIAAWEKSLTSEYYWRV